MVSQIVVRIPLLVCQALFTRTWPYKKAIDHMFASTQDYITPHPPPFLTSLFNFTFSYLNSKPKLPVR
jgi:hypothetical protein